MSAVVLSLGGVSKAFGAVQALRDVSVDCRAGEIHALVGENGSGKSTLLAIASGLVAQDTGVVEIDGRTPRRGDPAGARRLGLGMAYQNYSHVLDLSVAQNLYLAVPRAEQPPYGRIDEWAAGQLAAFDLDVPLRAPAGSLSLAQRQLLEVVKALLAKPTVLLLDEPTTALDLEEIERLHALAFERSRAGVGIVYVSHRLPEVLEIADRITVLRDGVCQGTFEAASMSEESLVALMIGRPLQLAFPERHAREGAREVLLVVSGLRGERFGPIDLEVGKGEILGIAGAEGNGQVQFLRALAGAERATGTARCDGGDLDTRSPLGPLRAGVVLLSGDRAREALFPVLSVRANATVHTLRRLTRLGFLQRRREQQTIDALAQRLRIRMASVEQPVQSLSGGNQQKVSLTRPFLRGDVKVILAEEPTQGVDVAARFDIYDALRAKAKEGVATIVKSSDPLELAGLCDRVVVMSRGRIVDEIPGEELGERRIVEAIVGARAGGREPLQATGDGSERGRAPARGACREACAARCRSS
jgi:ribose transport system ATP-binding protein